MGVRVGGKVIVDGVAKVFATETGERRNLEAAPIEVRQDRVDEVVPVDDAGKKKSDYEGQRVASTKGSTSEMAIRLNESNPLTFQDTGSAFMAVQQGKARGMVANTMTITKLVNESQTKGVPLKMIAEPMVYQPIGVGMKQGEPALLAKVNETLRAMDEDGQINEFWNKWLGPATEYKITRTDKVVPLAELKFTPIP